MGILEDTVKLLERIPGWKRIAESPDRIDALEKRIAELERQLSDEADGQLCPKCGKRQLKVVSSRPHPLFGRTHGTQLDTYRCQSCNYSVERMPGESLG